MKRIIVLAAAALIATGSTAVLATAHDRSDRPGSESRVTPIFDRFDLDGNGEVTREEVAAAAAQQFAAADANGDGQLSADEMQSYAEKQMAERRSERMAQRSARMLERHDANDDGMLSLEEMTAHEGEDRLERMFSHLDADEDGAITKAEAEKMASERGDRRWGKRFGRGHGHEHQRGRDRN